MYFLFVYISNSAFENDHLRHTTLWQISVYAPKLHKYKWNLKYTFHIQEKKENLKRRKMKASCIKENLKEKRFEELKEENKLIDEKIYENNMFIFFIVVS